jgi:hypothetical protein
MRLFIENLFAIAALVGTEAWFLKGYFAGQPDFEPAIAFIAALGVLLAKEPLKAHFRSSGGARLHDQHLFQAFLKTFPTEPTIRFLKDHDYGGAFDKQAIAPLNEFVNTWDSVENEFLDPEVEKQRKALFSLAFKLASEITRRTVPLRDGSYLSVFSDQQRASGQPRPASVLEDAKVLNATASDFVPKYEDFVRLCRSKFVD